MNDLSGVHSQFVPARVPRVSVVLPLRNAVEAVEDRIAQVAVEAEFSRINLCEIIAIDDGSEDLTWASLQSLAWREPRLRPIRLRKCFGLEAARETGAMAATGDIVITLEPDMPVSGIARFEGLIEAGHDVVTGLRPGGATAAYRREVLVQFCQAGTKLAQVPLAAGRAGYRVGRVCVPAPGSERYGRAALAHIEALGAAGGIFVSERILGIAMLAGLGLVCAGAVTLLTALVMALAGGGLSFATAAVAAGLLLAGLQVAGMSMLGSVMLAGCAGRSRPSGRIAETLLRHGAPD